MSGDGFGIAGHKNTYATGVRCGNWVEDTIGRDLVHMSRGAGTTTSEAQASFIPPKKMDDKAVRSCPKVTLGEAKGGMPAHLLFSHGLNPHDPEADGADRFATMTGSLFAGESVTTAQLLSNHPSAKVRKVLEKKSTAAGSAKAKQASKDLKASSTFATEASATQIKAKKQTKAKHARNSDFTKQYNRGIRGLRDGTTTTTTTYTSYEYSS